MSDVNPRKHDVSQQNSASDVGLANAFSSLLLKNRLGLVWLNDDLVVERTAGTLAEWVPVGVALCDEEPVFVGYEDAIRALAETPGEALTVPNVTLRYRGEDSPNFTIEITARDGGGFLVVFSSWPAQTQLEFELSRQVAKRRIAEEQILEGLRTIEVINRKLEQANKDLAGFARLISHDLKAPMRALNMTTKLLDDAVGRDDKAAIRSFNADLSFYARRMSDMLVGLLNYTRVGVSDETIATVDLGELLDRIVRSLPMGNARVVVDGELPILETAVAPLDLVMRNLIDNAVRHSGRDDVTVTVSAKRADRGWELCVADNGVGIPHDYHEAIFAPFVQIAEDRHSRPDNVAEGVALSGEDELGRGTGLGLAAIKRAVESVGGSIKVQNVVGAASGAEFRFVWPDIALDQGALRP